MARRNPRLDGTLRSVLATLLEEEFADPRLNFVTITEVESTPDVKHATVYYTALDPDLVSGEGSRPSDHLAEPHEVAAALESAAPRLQSLLSNRVRLRNTPQLRFVPDPVAEQAGRVEALLRQVRSQGESDA